MTLFCVFTFGFCNFFSVTKVFGAWHRLRDSYCDHTRSGWMKKRRKCVLPAFHNAFSRVCSCPSELKKVHE
ncbi:MAG: hypothetical protein DMG65_17410 [Candidatus Angelobacter sp. Gp1-AA117]|nr:MAG: hypothetical protein DMG65_17410 [Candidatus Angelobacter sp. Gp1-AA117]